MFLVFEKGKYTKFKHIKKISAREHDVWDDLLRGEEFGKKISEDLGFRDDGFSLDHAGVYHRTFRVDTESSALLIIHMHVYNHTRVHRRRAGTEVLRLLARFRRLDGGGVGG